jgi:hypothetical protein
LIITRVNSLPPSVADDRSRRISAGGEQVLLAEICSADREDPGALTGRQDALDQRDLHQARGRDRHADMSRYLALIERQKPAGRGDAVGTEADELFGRVEKFIEQPFGLVADDAARRGAGHDLV